MRYAMILAVTAALVAAPNAVGSETATGQYTGTIGFFIDSGQGYLFFGPISCTVHAATMQPGCFGGDFISSPSGAVYQVVHVTMNDLATGPNVFIGACLLNPAGGTLCEEPPGTVDGFDDALAQGCGVLVEVDATEIHEGNDYVGVIAYALHVDASTNTVCLGTSGDINVVFVS